jgi:hypothetical protein
MAEHEAADRHVDDVDQAVRADTEDLAVDPCLRVNERDRRLGDAQLLLARDAGQQIRHAGEDGQDHECAGRGRQQALATPHPLAMRIRESDVEPRGLHELLQLRRVHAPRREPLALQQAIEQRRQLAAISRISLDQQRELAGGVAGEDAVQRTLPEVRLGLWPAGKRDERRTASPAG